MHSVSDLGRIAGLKGPLGPTAAMPCMHALHIHLPMRQLLPDMPPRPSLSPRHIPAGLGFEKTVGLIDDSELSEPVLGTLKVHFSSPTSHPETPKLGSVEQPLY